MFTRTFVRRAVERAVKTAAQAALLTFGADQLDAFDTDWRIAGGMALGGAVLSLLTSVVTEPVGPAGDPSAV